VAKMPDAQRFFARRQGGVLYVCGEALKGDVEAKNNQAQSALAHVSDLSNEWSKCGTLAHTSPATCGSANCVARGRGV